MVVVVGVQLIAMAMTVTCELIWMGYDGVVVVM